MKRTTKERAIPDLLERLQERGWRMTPQRQAVARVLKGENVHLTADAVFDAARSYFPEIAIATVYNTLNELVTMGEILEVTTGGGPKRYDPNVTSAHHHLVCTSCGKIHDVQIDERDPILGATERHGFIVTGMSMVFQGLCPACQDDNVVEEDPISGI